MKMVYQPEDDDGLVSYLLPMDYHDINATDGIYKKGETITCTTEEKERMEKVCKSTMETMATFDDAPTHEVTKKEAVALNKELDKLSTDPNDTDDSGKKDNLSSTPHDPLKDEKERLQNATLENVYEVTEKYLHINDRKRIDIILATVLSNQLKGTPIWLYIVGASGDWKSAFLRSLEGIPHVKRLDQITKNTLASGMKDVGDLGAELQGRSTILLFPDLASITSMNTDEKNAIWGQFRNLYDGFIDKQTGSGVHRKYDNCEVTLIAGTTPAIRNEILIHAQLGTRELMYDTAAKQIDNDFKMDMALQNEDYEELMKAEIHKAVADFLFFHKVDRSKVPVSHDIIDFIKSEANRLSIL